MTGFVSSALAALAVAAGQGDPSVLFQRANEQYLHGQYDDAVKSYRDLVDSGWVSPSLAYNLGNACYRAGKLGWAVASWEWTLQLSPDDADALANLELARSKVVDRIEGAKEEPFLDRLLANLSSRAAVLLFGLPWVGLWGLLLARRRVVGAARPFLLAGVVAAALLAAGFGALLAAKARDTQRPRAVVVSKVAPVREGPSASLRAAFELHEGTTVRVVGDEGNFLRVRLPNGLEGWVAGSELAVIRGTGPSIVREK